MEISCLNSLVNNFNNIVRYPVLSLYLQKPLEFLEYYIVIEEDTTISICKKDCSHIICIEKNSDTLLFNFDIENYKNKKNKSKLFSIGNFEVYKKDADV